MGRQLFVIALSLGTVIFLARILGPEGRGQYAVVLLLSTSLAKFLNLGIAPANVFFLGQNKVSINVALATNIQSWWKLSTIGIVIAVAIISFKSNDWFPHIHPSLLFFSLLIFPVSLLQSYLISLLQGVQDFRRYNKILLVSPVVTFLLVVVLVKFASQGVVGAIIASTIGIIAGLIVSLLAIKAYLFDSQFKYDKEYELRCLSYGWKAHLSNILAFMNYKADIFMVNLFLTPADVGIYVVAVNISERLWILSSAVSTITLPRLAALHHDEAARKALTPIIARLVFFTTLLGAILLAAFSRPLVLVLFGSVFSEAIYAILWLIPGIVVLSLARALANDIAARGYPELNMYTSIFVVVINIISNAIFIPFMGIKGAAFATSISYIINACLKLYIYSSLSDNQWWEPLAIRKKDLYYFFGSK